MSIEFSDGKQEVPYHNDSFFWIVSGTVDMDIFVLFNEQYNDSFLT